ncbi:hypothetical protein ARMSODRAFT_978553 [Armillaria solidipes]|uniref:Uncharacterized protein n=1 Tax=Armillaria solidipes TaxID=1076256 RepID=A0A2H3BMP6_9AGAR|nr:hypothetical protein ARMSODRAFT_978553 [Armillaria solidipes]
MEKTRRQVAETGRRGGMGPVHESVKKYVYKEIETLFRTILPANFARILGAEILELHPIVHVARDDDESLEEQILARCLEHPRNVGQSGTGSVRVNPRQHTLFPARLYFLVAIPAFSKQLYATSGPQVKHSLARVKGGIIASIVKVQRTLLELQGSRLILVLAMKDRLKYAIIPINAIQVVR